VNLQNLANPIKDLMIKRVNRDQDLPQTSKVCELIIEKGLAKDIIEDGAPGTDNMTCMVIEFLK
jgi:hypothetical protein